MTAPRVPPLVFVPPPLQPQYLQQSSISSSGAKQASNQLLFGIGKPFRPCESETQSNASLEECSSALLIEESSNIFHVRVDGGVHRQDDSNSKRPLSLEIEKQFQVQPQPQLGKAKQMFFKSQVVANESNGGRNYSMLRTVKVRGIAAASDDNNPVKSGKMMQSLNLNLYHRRIFSQQTTQQIKRREGFTIQVVSEQSQTDLQHNQSSLNNSSNLSSSSCSNPSSSASQQLYNTKKQKQQRGGGIAPPPTLRVLSVDRQVKELGKYVLHKRGVGENSLLNHMQEHIESTNEIQTHFIEQSLKRSTKRRAIVQPSEKSEGGGGGGLLSKLNDHIQFTKDRDVSESLHREKQITISGGTPTSSPTEPQSAGGRGTSLPTQKDGGDKAELKKVKQMIRGIVDSHEKTVKHLEFAYDDVVEDAKREELLAKIKSATPDLNLHPPSATISGKQIDSLPPNSLTKGKTLLLQQKRQSIRSNSSSIHLQASNIQIAQLASPELQQLKKQLADYDEQRETIVKLSINPTHRLRERSVTMDLSDTAKKEEVLDRVLMNYFHQQDLLEEQQLLLRQQETARQQRLTRSNHRVSPSVALSELGSQLAKFQPSHMRLQLKQIISSPRTARKNPSSNNAASIAAAGFMSARTASNNDKQQPSTTSRLRKTNDKNEDVSIFRESQRWRRKQNEKINFSKVCSPAQMVLHFMHKDPLFRRQQCIEAIDFLVNFDPASSTGAVADSDASSTTMKGRTAATTLNSTVLDATQRVQEEVCRRIFFHFSNKNDAETSARFSFIDEAGFLGIFNSLSMTTTTSPCPPVPFLSSEQLIEIFKRVTKKKGKPTMSYIDMLEGLRRVIMQIDLTSSTIKSVQQIEATDIVTQQQDDDLFVKFFNAHMKANVVIFRDNNEREIIAARKILSIDRLLGSFEESTLRSLFIFAKQLRNQTVVKLTQTIYLSFQEIFEILTQLELFPNKISKNAVRYLYSYSLTLDQGLDFQDFSLFFHLLALTIMRSSTMKNSRVHINRKGDFARIQTLSTLLNTTVSSLKTKGGTLYDDNKRFIADISLFYFHEDLLNSNNLPTKLALINEEIIQQKRLV